jgi:putative transposase
MEPEITAWHRRRVSVSCLEQEAKLTAIRAAFPEYANVHSHLLQDVPTRLDKTYQAFFRRVRRGAKAGFPRFKGPSRFHSFTFNEYDNGARLENSFLVLSKIGRISVHWSRPMQARPRPSPSPRKPTAGMSTSPVPTYRCIAYHPPARRPA